MRTPEVSRQSISHNSDGFAENFIAARGRICWVDESAVPDMFAGEWDFDTMEWKTLFGLPYFPGRAIHVFRSIRNAETSYELPDSLVAIGIFGQVLGIPGTGMLLRTETVFTESWCSIPIRASKDLFFRCILRRWSWVVLPLSVVGIANGIVANDLLSQLVQLTIFGLLLFLFVIGLIWMSGTEPRIRSIRLILGQHQLGSSDPATWTGPVLELVDPPQSLFSTTTFKEAVEPSLNSGAYATAMWAARLSTALEDPTEGERLTDLVLNHPNVVKALEVLEEEPHKWAEEMGVSM